MEIVAQESETILQFGSGKFLRAFTDLFVDDVNREGQNAGRIVVIQSTDHKRADQFNASKGRYQALIRGYENGRTVDEVREITSVSRALVADRDWVEIRSVARSEKLAWIVSNTSEVGYQLANETLTAETAPMSFPVRLLRILHERFLANGKAIAVIPLELIDNNAHVLRDIVITLAETTRLGQNFINWLRDGVFWLRTLVDRITIDPPVGHPLLATDPLLTVTEPFAFWALEVCNTAGPTFCHKALLRTEDVRPYALRKVRILNGAHTALVFKAVPMGFQTVREAVENTEINDWLRELVFEEIIPSIEGTVPDPVQFANDCIDRFLNPFLDHRFDAIAVNQEVKVSLRLLPTYRAYQERFGRAPRLLTELLIPWL